MRQAQAILEQAGRRAWSLLCTGAIAAMGASGEQTVNKTQIVYLLFARFEYTERGKSHAPANKQAPQDESPGACLFLSLAAYWGLLFFGIPCILHNHISI